MKNLKETITEMNDYINKINQIFIKHFIVRKIGGL